MISWSIISSNHNTMCVIWNSLLSKAYLHLILSYPNWEAIGILSIIIIPTHTTIQINWQWLKITETCTSFLTISLSLDVITLLRNIKLFMTDTFQHINRTRKAWTIPKKWRKQHEMLPKKWRKQHEMLPKKWRKQHEMLPKKWRKQHEIFQTFRRQLRKRSSSILFFLIKIDNTNCREWWRHSYLQHCWNCCLK